MTIHEDHCLIVWFSLCIDVSGPCCVVLLMKHGVAWIGVYGGIDGGSIAMGNIMHGQ